MDLIYDASSGYVVDENTGEVVDQLPVLTPFDGFARRSDGEPADRMHYAAMYNLIRLPRRAWEAFKIALTYLRTRFGARVDYATLAKMVLIASSAARSEFVAAAAAVHVYAAKFFGAHVDAEELCRELQGAGGVCSGVGRAVLRLSSVFKHDRRRVIYSIIDSVASGELAFAAKVLVSRADISGLSSKIVAGAAIYIAGLMIGEYAPLERIARRLGTNIHTISRLVNSGRIAKVFRSRVGVPIAVEVDKEVCREVEKVAKLSRIVRCV